MNIFARPTEEAVQSLLVACGLPTSDLESKHFEHFFGCGSESAPYGVVGLEVHGEFGLLRSLAVSESVRGHGCGKELVQRIEAYALSQGVSELFLLTNSAEAFFAKFGYAVVNRNEVPQEIRETKEYSGICPSSATVMKKRLIDARLNS